MPSLRIKLLSLLHWTAGLTLYAIILAYWALGPMPGKLAVITAVMGIVCCYVGAAEVAIRRWRRRRAGETAAGPASRNWQTRCRRPGR